MSDLNKKSFEVAKHLNSEKILEINQLDDLKNKTFEELVIYLKQKFKETYPQTKLKRVMKSVHYANGFADENFKQSAFVLENVKQYLAINRFLDHDASVDYFNNKITSDSFVVNPENLIGAMLESLLISKGRSSYDKCIFHEE